MYAMIEKRIIAARKRVMNRCVDYVLKRKTTWLSIDG